jgi:hypothetical protein
MVHAPLIDSFHRKGDCPKQGAVIRQFESANYIGNRRNRQKGRPIAQIGSGFGSILESLLRLTTRNGVLMLPCRGSGDFVYRGHGFKEPLGAALFAAEVLYCKADFDLKRSFTVSFHPCRLIVFLFTLERQLFFTFPPCPLQS